MYYSQTSEKSFFQLLGPISPKSNYLDINLFLPIYSPCFFASNQMVRDSWLLTEILGKRSRVKVDTL